MLVITSRVKLLGLSTSIFKIVKTGSMLTLVQETHTLTLVLREFSWKEPVDFEHGVNHPSALSEHPHD